MSNEFDLKLRRYKVEEDQGWREQSKDIPYIQFPPDWRVKIIPPFGNAFARFRVLLPSGTSKSIYLDLDDSLGYYGEPYWEVYPYQGDVGRCAMADTAELIWMIQDETSGDES